MSRIFRFAEQMQHHANEAGQNSYARCNTQQCRQIGCKRWHIFRSGCKWVWKTGIWTSAHIDIWIMYGITKHCTTSGVHTIHEMYTQIKMLYVYLRCRRHVSSVSDSWPYENHVHIGTMHCAALVCIVNWCRWTCTSDRKSIAHQFFWLLSFHI